jgi:hypothetical protein
MKAYGLERHPYLEMIDACDQVRFAVKGSRCNLSRNAEGDRHNSVRSAVAKRATRRLQKRAARREGQVACMDWT